MSGEPYSKAQQLGAQRKRYRRKVVSRAQMQRLCAEKLGPCRVCVKRGIYNGHDLGRITFHHVVPKDAWGDDVADNLVPVHMVCHDRLHRREPEPCRDLVASLTDDEYAYAVTKFGEDIFERVYGITYER